MKRWDFEEGEFAALLRALPDEGLASDQAPEAPWDSIACATVVVAFEVDVIRGARPFDCTLAVLYLGEDVAQASYAGDGRVVVETYPADDLWARLGVLLRIDLDEPIRFSDEASELVIEAGDLAEVLDDDAARALILVESEDLALCRLSVARASADGFELDVLRWFVTATGWWLIDEDAPNVAPGEPANSAIAFPIWNAQILLWAMSSVLGQPDEARPPTD